MGCTLTKAAHDVATAGYASTSEFTLLQEQRVEGKVVSVYDGDTCHIALKHPTLKQIFRFKCRLSHIDTPELRTHNAEEKKAALKARNRLVSLSTDTGHMLPNMGCAWSKKLLQDVVDRNTRTIFLQCGKFDKYGRLLVVMYPTQSARVSINQTLINEGLAQPYEGGTKATFQRASI